MDDSASSPPSSIWATSVNSWFTSTVFFVLLNVMIVTIVFTSNLSNNNQQNHRQQHQEEEEKQNSQNHHDRHTDLNQSQIARSPSILHRLKSFNFLPHISQEEFSPENHRQQDPLQLAATQYVFNQPLEYQHFDYDFDPTGSVHTSAVTVSTAQFSAHNQTHDAPHVVWEHHQTLETEMNQMTRFNFDGTQEDRRSDKGFEDVHEEEHTDEFQSLDEVYSKLKSGHDRTKSESDLSSKPPAKMKKSASLKVGFAHIEEEETVEAQRPVTMRERKSAARVVAEDDVEVDSKADDFINRFKNDLKLQRIESIIRTKGSTGGGTAK
ncbi:hypothetical protein LXL04_007029 [Taraxacum kok-saghyz]